ncbi:hypothetical protein VNO77_25611 [Canavalia gladiata]|uniref:Uncharacterized protein n=1 Tax=Canavalia gladiata TaxID=3824 RepID=A0AAN9LDL4_CANGL
MSSLNILGRVAGHKNTPNSCQRRTSVSRWTKMQKGSPSISFNAYGFVLVMQFRQWDIQLSSPTSPPQDLIARWHVASTGINSLIACKCVGCSYLMDDLRECLEECMKSL